MKFNRLMVVFLVVGLILTGVSMRVMAEDGPGIVPIYEGSDLIYTDNFGFEEMPVVLGEDTVNNVEGYIRRFWLKAPEGRSPYEIIRNYEAAVENIDGQVLFKTRDPQSIEIDDIDFSDYYETLRQDRGLATGVMSFGGFPGDLDEYLVSRVAVEQVENYLIVAAGKGHWAAQQADDTYFEIVIIELEGMEMDMVTMAQLQEGLLVDGRVAIYDIYFDTGQSRVKAESEEALATISEFLLENSGKRYLVVGHTDYVGSYDMNLNLSEARAEDVVARLINDYGISQDQLTAVGVGPAAPVMSNQTEDGRAMNRRVEIVELE
ncbi:OmpA family protein [Halanaerobiaceae bacterium Z-7014]|uniref:OmpA family protein n=1 Tax=Halonatronomonas betaini TaxID=2778430 RepID=A0A931F6G1_9FIRM|nr:OmpA family protein [Halonatronomonas betaini]MBF8436885.1 OmpA family protein [Halonatronomonas betaini]